MARRAIRDQSQRRLKEREAAEMMASEPTDGIWAKLEPELDAALAALNDTDRNTIVLRYLQQRSFREVGISLNITEDAAKKRAIRGLEKLRAILERRGIRLASAVLGTALATATLSAASPQLISISIKSALSKGVAMGPGVLHLIDAAVRDALKTKFKIGLSVAALAIALVVGIVQVTQQREDDIRRGLGDERYGEYQRIRDSRYQDLNSLVIEGLISRQALEQVYDLIKQNDALVGYTPESKNPSILQIRKNSAQIRTILGPDNYDLINRENANVTGENPYNFRIESRKK